MVPDLAGEDYCYLTTTGRGERRAAAIEASRGRIEHVGEVVEVLAHRQVSVHGRRLGHVADARAKCR